MAVQELQDKGFELYAAYGNTGTDAKAYESVGVPKERCASLLLHCQRQGLRSAIIA